MKRYHVYNGNSLIRAVTADKAFFHTGNLVFYNKSVTGERYGDNVAAFVAGSFTHYATIGEVSECTSSSSSFPVPTPEAPELSPQEAAWSAS